MGAGAHRIEVRPFKNDTPADWRAACPMKPLQVKLAELVAGALVTRDRQQLFDGEHWRCGEIHACLRRVTVDIAMSSASSVVAACSMSSSSMVSRAQ